MNNDGPFVATILYPEGWMVLSPWIETVDGHRYRHHIAPHVHGRGRYDREREAKHLAAQLNAAVRREEQSDDG